MVTNRRLVTAKGLNFYPTPAWGTQALLNEVTFIGCIHEPCCGDGAMSKVLIKNGYTVTSADIVDRGWFGVVQDFRTAIGPFDNVVTNPPFNIAEDLLEHALNLTSRKVCFLLRTAFLESKRRYNKFYKHNPPSLILVFSERLSMYPKGYKVKSGGTTSYAWFVWDNENKIKPITQVLWIPPGLKNG